MTPTNMTDIEIEGPEMDEALAQDILPEEDMEEFPEEEITSTVSIKEKKLATARKTSGKIDGENDILSAIIAEELK